MKRILLLVTFVLAVLLGIPAPVFGQTTPQAGSSAPAVSPTNAVPDAAMTPGTGGLTPGPRSTPGSNLYSLPSTTPVGMPVYSITSTTPGASETPSAAPRPSSVADCAKDGWRNYGALRFTSQKNCEAWVKRHPAGAAGARTVGTPTMPTTPGAAAAPSRRRTPAARVPPSGTTPGSSITPMNPTPSLRAE